MPIRTKIKQNGNSTENYLAGASKLIGIKELTAIAEESLEDFKKSSPSDEIAKSWSYEIVKKLKKYSLYFTNSQVKDGVNIVILIDVGHGTRDGYWVSGKNFLSKPIQDAYDRIIKKTWEALKAYERH